MVLPTFPVYLIRVFIHIDYWSSWERRLTIT